MGMILSSAARNSSGVIKLGKELLTKGVGMRDPAAVAGKEGAGFFSFLA
jgi:hypothetical protein